MIFRFFFSLISSLTLLSCSGHETPLISSSENSILADLPVSSRQSFYRNQFRVALNGTCYNEYLASKYPVAKCVSFRDQTNHFHYNRGPLSKIIANGGSLVKRTTSEESTFVGIYFPKGTMDLARSFLPNKDVLNGFFSNNDEIIDFKYVCALGKREFNVAYVGDNDGVKNSEENSFKDVYFLSFEKAEGMPYQTGGLQLVGIFKETKAYVTSFVDGIPGTDYEHSFLQASVANGAVLSVAPIDSDICAANRDPLIGEHFPGSYVYLPSDVNRPFVEALFTPRGWYGGFQEVATYGYCDESYLYYPIASAEAGDTSLSDEEFSFISGGCMEEKTRESIIEILNVPDTTSPKASNKHMKVAKIDYHNLFSKP